MSRSVQPDDHVESGQAEHPPGFFCNIPLTTLNQWSTLPVHDKKVRGNCMNESETPPKVERGTPTRFLAVLFSHWQPSAIFVPMMMHTSHRLILRAFFHSRCSVLLLRASSASSTWPERG
ncbi:hypothetical protein AVEN_273574-1 [Araneus ventricosus]|uniref:Uncharacterized protein n=1 Tax=Araneus ventricosus TaxID=182803 RepID=A0A4Y2VVM7_ARAVE|nr:hypothetical protein AVEN_273574-1 [Araneus ventricosus]